MLFDDRLATVLQMRSGSDAVLRTQFRQLLDLLGSQGARATGELREAGFARLGELMKQLPQEDQSRILRQPGLRLRNRDLVAFLASGEAKLAAAAMATAQLGQDDWLTLIPRLPVAARGFLRHRRDLPERVRRQLAELGVVDMVLPHLDSERRRQDSALRPETTDAAPTQAPPPSAGISALLRRIETFRQTRQGTAPAPGPAQRLPLPTGPKNDREAEPLTAIEFASDARGTVVWASERSASMLVGLDLAAPRAGTLLTRSARASARLAAHLPLSAERIAIDAAPAVSGAWVCDAAPLFDEASGAFTGYRGRLCRSPAGTVTAVNDDGEGDAMRQVLHELRTPVGAIQGFAEIIQQQLFGPAPHEYRAHAAGIAVDAAKLLAGFDEMDRLVKLEAGAVTLEPGTSDFHVAIGDTVKRLQNVLHSRGADFVLEVMEGPFLVPLAPGDALSLAWRLLATTASAMAPGETITIRLDRQDATVQLRIDCPSGLVDSTAADRGPSRRGAVSAGMFGPKFAFRLARAEAAAIGGALQCDKDQVTLVVPSLTGQEQSLSAGNDRARN
ncbi:sensor histidine kinase [Erythrobacter arachoides]|uniref:histidine kinase n=1 Tax=Aurantiacibacter arachoides TaxID=1850444 RepID=A0A845A5L3_9SPHN|nr:HAMP domain-containing histidine kinase [Aurantiacibacter arachoides]MXO92849.1 sensor histidine kinase [Aurantiacibacter arachoides]GGD53996.1 hypothetical protein GCM10011411_12370 [Aurantiacibacter arachoides]